MCSTVHKINFVVCSVRPRRHVRSGATSRAVTSPPRSQLVVSLSGTGARVLHRPRVPPAPRDKPLAALACFWRGRRHALQPRTPRPCPPPTWRSPSRRRRCATRTRRQLRRTRSQRRHVRTAWSPPARAASARRACAAAAWAWFTRSACGTTCRCVGAGGTPQRAALTPSLPGLRTRPPPQANHRTACSVCHEPYEVAHDSIRCASPPATSTRVCVSN